MSEDEYGQQPPHDHDAEQAVLGAMLSSAKAVADVMAILKAEDFHRPAHALIFDVIIHLFGGGADVDAMLVSGELGVRGKLTNVGGAGYLLTCIQSCPTATNATYYARAVIAKAKARRIVETGVRLQQMGYSEMTTDEELELVVAQAEQFLKDIRKPTDDGIMFADLAREWQEFQNNPNDIIPTPWMELNDYLAGGLRKGKLYVLAGRPGSGKSMGGLNIVSHQAEMGFKAQIFSLEMGKLEVAGRLLASGGYASYSEVFRKEMSRQTRDKVMEYIDTQRAMNLEVIDRASITVEQIAAHIRNRKPDSVLIDYCQLITASFKGDRREAIDHVTRSLKIAAAENHCAIVLASQVNRNGADRMPTIADLRESGSIENDADVVLLLHREDEGSGFVKMNVGKNRDGKQGTIEFVWRGDLARIG